MAGNVSDAFYQHEGFSVSTRMSKGWEIVWFVLVWTVWTTRNEKLFNRGEVEATCRRPSNDTMKLKGQGLGSCSIEELQEIDSQLEQRLKKIWQERPKCIRSRQ
ncbi:hypothetical protein SLA2020_322950 [Shorea laevis]